MYRRHAANVVLPVSPIVGKYLVMWIGLLTVALTVESRPQDAVAEQLASEHRRWLEEEVVYIISENERNVFLDLETFEERALFMDAFWEKRDPDPITPQNELKEEHYRRLEHANEVFGRETSLPGWRTDQGRMYIILGEPIQIDRFDGYRDLVSTHLWFYQGEPRSGLPPFFYLVFFKKFDAGAYTLYSPQLDGPRSLLATGLTSGISDLEALSTLRRASPELERASLSFDPSDPGDVTRGRPSLGFESLLAKIEASPTRAFRTDYADAWMRYGRKVGREYSFNFVPSRNNFAVLAGLEETPFVHYSIELDSDNFTLLTDESRSQYRTAVNITLEVTDDQGRLVETRDDDVYIELSSAQAREVGASPFSFHHSFPLIPGNYELTVILRNRLVKQYTVAERHVQVPQLPTDSEWISDVVLGFHSEEVEGAGGEYAVRAFQIGSWLVYPSSDAIFSLREAVHVVFQIGNAGSGGQLHFVLAQGDEVLGERTTPTSAYPDGIAREVFPLGGGVGGNAELIVQLLDSAGNPVAERRTELMISPRTTVPRPGFVSRRSFDAEMPGLLSLTRGNQLFRSDRKKEAQKEYADAVEAAGPSLPQASWQLAWLFVQSGQAEAALELLAPLEDGFRQQFEVVAGIGMAAYLQHDFAKAADYLERASRMRSPGAPVLNALGDSLAREGRFADARDAFERSLSIDPQQPSVRERMVGIDATPKR